MRCTNPVNETCVKQASEKIAWIENATGSENVKPDSQYNESPPAASPVLDERNTSKTSESFAKREPFIILRFFNWIKSLFGK